MLDFYSTNHKSKENIPSGQRQIERMEPDSRAISKRFVPFILKLPVARDSGGCRRICNWVGMVSYSDFKHPERVRIP